MDVEGEKKREISVGNTWGEKLLRVLAFFLTLIAAILLAVNKQTKMIPISISPNLPPFTVPVTSKSSYVSAFVYFVAANSIACAFAAISLVLAFSKLGRKVGMLLVLILMDLMMVVLLFSGIGATGAVGLIGYNGNSHLRWNKVCNVYGKFCHQTMAALALSLFGAIAYFLLIVLTTTKLVRRL